MSDGKDPSESPFGIPGVEYRDLVLGIQEGLWLIDADGVTVFVNERMAEIARIPVADIVGRPVLDFFTDASRSTVLDQLRRRREGIASAYETDVRRGDGSMVHVRVHAGPVMRDGKLIASVAAVTDLTDVHEAMREREAALAEAQEANLVKTRFLSWASHELRTPLNSISGFAQLLRARLVDPADQEMAGHIVAASSHVDSLVHDLLDYSRAEANALSPDLVPLSLRDALDEAGSLVAGEAHESDVRIERSDDDDIYVVADRRQLVQVLVNVLSNAVKYGGRRSTVTVTTTADAVTARCNITDQGTGIPLDQQRAVFRPFERLATASDVSGVGLGLAIADSFMRSMHGSITVASPPGQGATFTIEVPVHTPPSRTAPPPDDGERLVLYVEDEPLNASLVTSIVGLLPGRTIEVAGTVAEGLAVLATRRPSLLLLDLNLPDGSGLEVLRLVRADPALRHLPVFILSADATQQASATAIEAGADRFITKPLKVNDFLALVDSVTG